MFAWRLNIPSHSINSFESVSSSKSGTAIWFWRQEIHFGLYSSTLYPRVWKYFAIEDGHIDLSKMINLVKNKKYLVVGKKVNSESIVESRTFKGLYIYIWYIHIS